MEMPTTDICFVQAQEELPRDKYKTRPHNTVGTGFFINKSYFFEIFTVPNKIFFSSSNIDNK